MRPTDNIGFTRRRILQDAGRTAAAAAASLFLPPNVRRALAQGPSRHGVPQDVKHVVILMPENRSFDHYFGTLSGVRGFDDAAAMKLPGGRSVFHQPDALNPNGYLLPFHLATGASSAQKIPSTSHAWAVQHEAWNGGRMDQWLPAHRKADGVKAPYVMRLQAGRHSFPVRAGRSFHHLRRLSLLRHGTYLSQSHVSDDRHDRS